MVSLTSGLYLVRQASRLKPGVHHYGVLDVGNWLHLPFVDLADPTIVQQSPPHIQFTRLSYTGQWELLCKAASEPEAVARLHVARQDPTYNVLWHNCEHFARYVVMGTFESRQVQGVVAVVGIGALLFASSRSAA